MAGKDLYIGRMLEHLQESMDSQIKAMQTVASQIVTVAENTGQTITRLNVKPGTKFNYRTPEDITNQIFDNGTGDVPTAMTMIPGMKEITSNAMGRVTIHIEEVYLRSFTQQNGIYFNIANAVSVNGNIVETGEVINTQFAKNGNYRIPGMTKKISVAPGDKIVMGVAISAASAGYRVDIQAVWQHNTQSIRYSLSTLTQDGAFY